MTVNDMANTSERIAGNMILLAVARVSMALALPTIGLIFWLYSSWQADQMADLQKQIVQTQSTAQDTSKLAMGLSERLVAVETKQVRDAASSEKFQSATLTRLDRVQDSIVGLSNAVAALTATLQTVVDDRRVARPPP